MEKRLHRATKGRKRGTLLRLVRQQKAAGADSSSETHPQLKGRYDAYYTCDTAQNQRCPLLRSAGRRAGAHFFTSFFQAANAKGWLAIARWVLLCCAPQTAVVAQLRVHPWPGICFLGRQPLTLPADFTLLLLSYFNCYHALLFIPIFGFRTSRSLRRAPDPPIHWKSVHPSLLSYTSIGASDRTPSAAAGTFSRLLLCVENSSATFVGSIRFGRLD